MLINLYITTFTLMNVYTVFISPVTKKDSVRAEIIRDLLNEEKTVEEIEMIIRCFGLQKLASIGKEKKHR